jgi:CRISPR/Cas system CSM-associated protein Csm3 (group 7 of RAMP superfamily)
MHKRRLNELTLDILIEPAGPLLIKSGQEAGADPTLSSMNFVRTRHPTTGERTIYLPGSSLKGVIRSHTEQIIRTVYGENPDICCDPLGRNACGRRHHNVEDTAEQYKRLCLACRIFGHTVNAGHFLTADAYPAEPIDTLPVRNNVAIDRLSGGVAVGPFDMEVALEGQFVTRLTLINFELWQVGVLALALRDLAVGRVQIGYAKTRGLGKVNVKFGRLEFAYPGRFKANGLADSLYGVGALAPDLLADYGYVSEDTLTLTEPGTLETESVAWGRPVVRFGLAEDVTLPAVADEQLAAADAEVQAVFKQVVQSWAAYEPRREG